MRKKIHHINDLALIEIWITSELKPLKLWKEIIIKEYYKRKQKLVKGDIES